MTLDNMTGITEGSYTGFCKSQLITCNFVKACNGVCPFEDALKHADKEMDKQTVIDHDRDWIIGCIQHDGFIHTHRFDKANQIILDALSAETLQGWIPCSEGLPKTMGEYLITVLSNPSKNPTTSAAFYSTLKKEFGTFKPSGEWEKWDVVAWMPTPEPYKGGDDK